MIDVVDIVNDPVPEHKYKESEDPKKVQILKTDPPRGPLKGNEHFLASISFIWHKKTGMLPIKFKDSRRNKER